MGHPFPYPNPTRIPRRFSNLSGADVTVESTAIYTFYELPGEPWVRVRPGGDLNRPYFSAILASQSKNRKRLMKGKIDADMLEKNREVDRKLYPRHIDAGEWGGWQEALPNADPTALVEYEDIEYSPQGFKELMEQLPADLFDELRAFCNEPVNFRSEDEPDLDDIAETAGN